MCGAGEPVWSAGVDLERGSRDDLRGLQRRCSDRDDLVVVAVCGEGRDVEALEILGEVRLRERLDAVERALQSRLHRHQPERVAGPLRDGRAWPVGAVERRAQVLVELRTIGRQSGAELVEHLDRRTLRIGVGLEHQGWDRTQQHSLRNARGAVPADVARDLAAARGVTYMDRVMQVERFDQPSEVVCVGVHVVARPRLARATVTTAVVRDCAKAVRRDEDQLVVPRVGIQRPPMTEYDWLPSAPVLVEDLGPVAGRNACTDVLGSDRVHRSLLVAGGSYRPARFEASARRGPPDGYVCRATTGRRSRDNRVRGSREVVGRRRARPDACEEPGVVRDTTPLPGRALGRSDLSAPIRELPTLLPLPRKSRREWRLRAQECPYSRESRRET